jgi:hypothetical protein
MALETETGFKFIGHELEVRRLLKRQELFEEADGCRRPVRPMVATRELGSEPGSFLEKAGAEPIKVGTADLEVVRGIGGINLTSVKLSDYLLEKQMVQAPCDLLFL